MPATQHASRTHISPPQLVQGEPGLGPVMYHPPSEIDGEKFSGWHSFPGADIEYLSRDLTKEIIDAWGGDSWTEVSSFLRGARLALFSMCYESESRWITGGLDDLAILISVSDSLRDAW